MGLITPVLAFKGSCEFKWVNLGERVFRIMCHDVMSATVITKFDRRNAVVFLPGMYCTLGERRIPLQQPVSLLGRCFRFIYPFITPQQSCEGGILQMRTLRNKEVKPHDKVAQLEYWSWTQIPAWLQHFCFLLDHSAHYLRVGTEQPSKEHECEYTRPGANQGRGSCHLTGAASFYKCIIFW